MSIRVSGSSPHPLVRSAGMLAGLYLFPVALLATGAIPFTWRFHTLILAASIAIAASSSRGYSNARLGMAFPRFSSLAAWSVVPTALLVCTIAFSNFPGRHLPPDRLLFYLFFVFISAPAQEFLYRSFLFAELGNLQVPQIAITVISALLFALMHAIYRDVVTVALTFLVGLVWAVIYNATQSFYIVAISHAALGAAAIWLGVI